MMFRTLEHLPNQRGGVDETPPDCEVIAFDDPVAFVRELNPVGALWLDTARDDWIFRGQADASWPLTPSAHRDRVLESWLIDSGSDATSVAAMTQQQRELSAVLRFVQQCRSASIPVPEDGQALRAIERAERERVFSTYHPTPPLGEEWPPAALASLFAIAQHHGVPTRLLDWSRSPYVAAYFALRGAATQAPSPDGKLAVWAFNHSWVTGLGSVLCPGMRLVEAPHDANLFLRAQRGVFTVVQNERMNTPVEGAENRFPFGEVVSYAWWYLPTMAIEVGPPWVRKMTLPQECAGHALRLLDRVDVNPASLFPNHGGVTMALAERRLWR